MATEYTSPFKQSRGKSLYLQDGATALIVVAAIFIILLGLQLARSVVVPILMGSFLAIISYSATYFLRRYLRFPHWLAVTFTVLLDSAVIYGVFLLVKYLAADMRATLQGELMAKIAVKYNDLMAFLDKLGLGEQARAVISSPSELFDAKLIFSTTQALTGFMASTTLVLILMAFLLAETPLFLRNLNRLPTSSAGKSKVVDAILGVQRYLFIKTVASAVTGLLAGCLCAWMNVPFAFLWGVVAYLLNYIPTIGSIVAAIPPILLALFLGTWGECFVVAAGYLAINCAIGNCIEPIFMGKQFGISTSVVLLSVLLWGWVLGPCGMLLSVPITVLIKLAMENSRDLAWIATLIDDTKTEKAIRKEMAVQATQGHHTPNRAAASPSTTAGIEATSEQESTPQSPSAPLPAGATATWIHTDQNRTTTTGTTPPQA